MAPMRFDQPLRQITQTRVKHVETNGYNPVNHSGADRNGLACLHIA